MMRSCTASTIHSGCGKKYSSSSCAGVIQFLAPTTIGGASVIKRQLADRLCKVFEVRTPLAGVARDNDLACLLHRFQNLLIVERNERTRIYDLCGNTVFLLEDVRRFLLPLYSVAPTERIVRSFPSS